jgi:hypothetical protein
MLNCLETPYKINKINLLIAFKLRESQDLEKM